MSGARLLDIGVGKRSAAKNAQRRFVRCFPDHAEWIDYIDRHGD
jgi:hypothetical protein